jgi:hypothetical protein
VKLGRALKSFLSCLCGKKEKRSNRSFNDRTEQTKQTNEDGFSRVEKIANTADLGGQAEDGPTSLISGSATESLDSGLRAVSILSALDDPTPIGILAEILNIGFHKQHAVTTCTS